MKSKKELKQAYKNHHPTMGVFQIKNKLNGKCLIEGSIDINARWNRHQTELRFGSHRNKALQKDWNQATKEAFSMTILSELEFKNDQQLNYQEEVKTLTTMILEELNLPAEQQY